MRAKYKSVGLNLDIITEAFPDLAEYEETVNAYLSDENFTELGNYLDDEDYALAKDAVKGLYLLAQDLRLFPLYETLLEVYEDLMYEMYDAAYTHYREMIEVYRRIRSVFYV
ncbi:MAG: hypothetical protein IIZ47_05725 [Erysipelotrichaceae bacterium]|nr:hypothetical protein [Erysipelotrichaceae bacterium]